MTGGAGGGERGAAELLVTTAPDAPAALVARARVIAKRCGALFSPRRASVTRLLADAATVFDVDTARTGIGLGDAAVAGPISSVTLLVPRTLAADIAHAQVNGTLTLALAPGEGPP